MCKFHVWPCDTTCADEDLEEFLGFMSDDYLTYESTDEDTSDAPTYNQVATLMSF